MRSYLAALLLLPGLASAVTLTKVGTVPTNGGKPIAIADGARLHDGTWVVGDSARAFWASVDQGVSWAPVPPLSGDTIWCLGDAVVSNHRYRLWNAAKGWHDMTFPDSWNAIAKTTDCCAEVWGHEGFAEIQSARDTDLHYYVSSDGLDTWNELLTVSFKDVPDSEYPVGNYALGKIWYVVADSGYARGTADGLTWSRISLPYGMVPYRLTSKGLGSILAAVGTGNPSSAYSLDSGRTWVEGAPEQPYGLWAAGGGWYLSLIGNAQSWISADLLNWESIGMAVDAFFEGGLPYAIKADGLYRIDAVAGSAGLAGSKLDHGGIRLSRTSKAFVAHLDASRLGKSWQVVGADGSVHARGTASSQRLELPALRGAGWLKIGGATLAIPAL